MEMFNMGRFDLARQRRGLTKRDLAKKLKVTDRTISNWYNNGEVELQMLEKASEILNFPISFFYGEDIEEVSVEAVSFRALSKMTAKKRNIALSQTRIAKLISHWIDSNFDLPETNVPDLHELRNSLVETTQDNLQDQIVDESLDIFYAENSYPEACATFVRKAWGLGEQPIPNLIALLESKGIRVFSLSDDAQEVDACCEWSGGRPFIFLNTAKTSERCRFDAAHELGHLVMHKHGITEGRHMEQEANAFASSFLMPRRGILAEPLKIPSLNSIVVKKKIWKVSAAALTYRYNKLGLISDWNAVSIYKQLAKNGKTIEPQPIPHETSMLLDKVFFALDNDGIHGCKVANDLDLYLNEINSLTFGLASKYIETKANSRRANLRILD